MNTRWGNDPRGSAPWYRYEYHFSGRDKDGYAVYECRLAEISTDYPALWQRGSDAFHADHGISGYIADATTQTVFYFD